MLCDACDKTIHSANVLSSRHVRVPVCGLCHRSPSVWWCEADAAHLCSVCDAEVHEGNPLPHTRVPVTPCCGGAPAPPTPAAAAGPSSAAPAAAAQAVPAAAAQHNHTAPHEQCADETSACKGDSSPLLDNTNNTQAPNGTVVSGSEAAVVPEMCSSESKPDTATELVLQQQQTLLAQAPSMPKGFDFLDLDNSWLDRLDTGFDFSDIFNGVGDVPASDGLVPTLSDNSNPNHGSSSQQLHQQMMGNQRNSFDTGAHSPADAYPAHNSNDLAVTFSLSLPDELPMPQLGALKRPADMMQHNSNNNDLLMPQAKQQRSLHAHAHSHAHNNNAQQYAQYPMGVGMNGMQPKMEQANEPLMHSHGWHSMPTPNIAPVMRHSHHNHHTNNHHTNANNNSSAGLQHRASAPLQTRPSVQYSMQVDQGMNLTREQRVARYREKRKNRKFQKTIRYASRKAYAEVRPRIKGRFATRDEVIAMKAEKQQQQQLDEDCVVPDFA